MRILLDAIHADLLESLHILFADRLGWEVYVPDGMDWHTEGLFNYGGEPVAHQFLDRWATDEVVIPWADAVVWRILDAHPHRRVARITLDGARATKWDVVLSTLSENDLALAGFAHEQGAHFGIQVGNQGAESVWAAAEFGLLSVTTPGFVPWKPFVTYHQEFRLRDFSWPPENRDLTMTRVQCFTGTPDYERMKTLHARGQDLRFAWHGHCGEPDDLFGGNAHSTAQMVDEMREAGSGYHVKRWSDGYGHVGFQWFANGRPVVGSASYYADKLMGPLWVEGVTSWDIDRMGDAEVLNLLRRFRDDDDFHREACLAARARFEGVVNFDAEEAMIRDLLSRVL
jgi:hypothetical protein